MSTSFIADGPIPFDDLRTFDHDGVRARLEDGNLILTDGTNCLHVYAPTRSWPITFQRCGSNDASGIIRALETTFNVDLVSEHDDEFEAIKKRHRSRTGDD